MPDNYRFGQVRQPFRGSEDTFFQENPHVGGRADFESGTIVLNPYSTLKPNERESVRVNEFSRLIMRKHKLSPEFPLTAGQEKAFAHYGSPLDQRETIVGRILSGDPSAGDITKSQREFADMVRGYFD